MTEPTASAQGQANAAVVRDLVSGLQPGPVPVVMWSFGPDRRAVLCSGPNEAKDLMHRILGRFCGGARDYRELSANFGQLADPDHAVTTRYGRHVLSIVRPYLGDSVGPDADKPTLISIAGIGETPRWPCLFASTEQGRDWVRALRNHGVSAHRWRQSELETVADGGGKLRFSVGASLRTELESELISRFGRRGRERQGFSPIELVEVHRPGRRQQAA